MTHVELLEFFAKKQLAALIEKSVAAALNQTRIDFQAARVRLRLPPVLLDTDRTYKLPSRFACPECGGRTGIEVYEWGARAGLVAHDGFTVHCIAEDEELWASMEQDRDEAWSHRHWQSDWQPLIEQVRRWVFRNIRVRVQHEQ